MIGLGITNCRSARDVVAGVVEAEALGAGVAFIAEDVNCRDSFELCALSAMSTSRIRLSTGVVNPYTRNPTSLAMAVATLDEISRGRACLGIGTSSPSLIQEQMGVRVGQSVQVMREATEIIRRLLAGETVDYAGQYFQYTNAHLEVSAVQERVPIFFAAMGPKTLQLAGAVADGVLLNVGASVEYVQWAMEQIEAGARRAGRSPEDLTVAAWLTAYVVENRDDGLQRARQWLATMLSIPRQGELLLERGGFDASILPAIRERVSGYPHGGDPLAASRHVPEEYAERMALVGTADEVQARIDEYRGAGVQLPVVGLPVLRALIRPGSQPG